MVQMEAKDRFPRVLMYHSISRPEVDYDPLCTSPERFEAQMLYLKRHDLRGVSMRELYLALSAGEATGLIGVTFDDGYEDFLDAAVPTLEKLGFSATVFVVAGMLGSENTWEHGSRPRPQLKLLGADGVREVSERGMEIGSHSVNHPRLSGLASGALIREVEDSRQMLSKIVNAPIEGFSYPYGAVDGPAVRAARKVGYVYAVATKKQVEGGLHDWPRTYVGEKDSPLRLGVKLKVSPILTWWRHRALVNQNEPSGT
jgi:peptidoglycan/xylan/chitin deacetylase (PgdA/CDA1 family)